jgi:diguanylate cyclase (GGDEF)-like protein/PAS domain S-box-containing protein
VEKGLRTTQQSSAYLSRSGRATKAPALLALVAVFVCAAVAQNLLRDRAQAARSAEVELARVRSRASLIALHQDRAVNSELVSVGVEDKIRVLEVDIDDSLRGLPQSASVDEVVASVDSFLIAVREDLDLIEAGEMEQAKLLDSHRVNLWYEETNRAVDDAVATQRAVADRTESITSRGSLAILALACLAIGGLLLRFERARAAAASIHRRVLEESEARFRTLVQNSDDAIAVVEADGIIRYQSPAAARVFGVDPAATLGESFVHFLEPLIHPDDLARVLAFGRDVVVEPGRTAGLEYRVRTPDGWRCVESTATNSLADPHVLGVVVTSRDISTRKALEDRLRFQAFHDPLTQLPNRTLLKDRLTMALARRSNPEDRLAVLLLDLDGFKAVNDTLGHSTGDDLLVQVAERLAECIRAGDSVARLGGDEFAVLLEVLDSQDSPDAAQAVADRMLESLAQPFVVEGRKVFLGASVGIVVASASDSNPVDLLRDADVAMYAAKAEGKNRSKFFEPGMRRAVLERMTMESDLRGVTTRRQLALFYQPIVELATGSIVGVEALVRWRHPQRGLVPPAQFIPLAEETGLILDIGRWVLREACIQIKDWQERFSGASLKVTVNISGRQLGDARLLDDIHANLRELEIGAESVVLEITESVLMRHTGRVEEMIARLQELGLRFAIDDFGTGYSSLGYLQSFPVDILKIDRSFVTRVAAGPEESALARAIVKLAHSLGLTTVAEGIEDEDQLNSLRAMGCSFGQGYYFSPPLPAADMEDLLRVARTGEPWEAGRALTATA